MFFDNRQRIILAFIFVIILSGSGVGLALRKTVSGKELEIIGSTIESLDAIAKDNLRPPPSQPRIPDPNVVKTLPSPGKQDVVVIVSLRNDLKDEIEIIRVENDETIIVKLLKLDRQERKLQVGDLVEDLLFESINIEKRTIIFERQKKELILEY
jgi:hypothetical protein